MLDWSQSIRTSMLNIFKYFKSNSNLHTDLDPFANPIEEASSENGWKLYKDFIEKLIQRVTELAAIHSNISLEGFVWIQGESDRGVNRVL